MTTGRRILYTFLILGFVAAAGALLLRHPVAPIPKLQARHGAMALGGEWLNTRNAVGGLQARLRKNPDDHQARLLLAQAYIQEGRVTGNHPYYDAAALQLADEVLAQEPENFEALCTKAVICLSQHHFSQGLAVAQKAADLNPANAFVQGLMCDAYVELGHYAEAVKAADRMNQLRPDLRAYARVSYLREIHGDLNGAREAMDMAVKAGVPGLEQTEWCRVVLGRLYENSGDLNRADEQYQMAMATRPNYAYALAGLARTSLARGNYPAAIKQLTQARLLVRDYAFMEELTEAYRLNNEPRRAEQAARAVVNELAADANAADENEALGHYSDRELAYAYLKTNELDKALQHAKIEYDRRPANIDVCEAMAWVHYRRGEYKEAQQYMRQARRTGSQNPQLLYRAGCIALRSGQVAEGQALLQQAKTLNPYLLTDPADQPLLLTAAR
ncbi:tetratricopeptide repeat protein [Hymenobacter busanensis]|uniref:Tetratricopeptide repeat protein n=1 Tax=Hymenobacter busanensis TaxID=2607656 RepID=A0A7L5A0Z0_9BACT|nr:tetratricopeptide repeat protein [Hymenobacter busanensis]KAA9338633.1 tetratricopeptide repeat protein [Hymenobacter busanensis]QHJ08937.1 tetratricopeptide repeat protein [Hymenobacter busanensis]